ncbi:phage terminase small subunit-related protein [Paenibacillus rigui]|uniref:Terminase n=1 Tax=Paenibacillus rigui TaxID=554312 RepID=A0A229UMA2_9BACL|nr:phage terminase small subunit-related protein [Paenibacillus rigui]OXM84597.1 terminase [Paenibacillus rigui]
MARERSPDRDKAKQMWLDSNGSKKLKDIAAALGLGETQIRKWKSQDKWADALKGNVTNQKKGNVTKRIGAPLGNKNALGNKGGAPKGNQNAKGNRGGHGGPFRNKKALKTGEYETIWLDALEDDERLLYELIDTDPIVQVDEGIKLASVRERRMLLRIQRLTNGLTEKGRRVLQERKAIKDPVSIHDEKTGKTTVVTRERFELIVTEIEENEARLIDDILAHEEALTRVQDKKAKWIDLKHRMETVDEEKLIRIEKLKFELRMLQGGGDSEGSDDGFVEALRGKAAEVWADEGQT